MKLPENKHITKCFSTREIAEKMNDGEYSAEMLLQHLAIHWNRVEAWGELSDSDLRLRCGELTAQEIRTVRAVLNAILANGEYEPRHEREREMLIGFREAVRRIAAKPIDSSDMMDEIEHLLSLPPWPNIVDEARR